MCMFVCVCVRVSVYASVYVGVCACFFLCVFFYNVMTFCHNAVLHAQKKDVQLNNNVIPARFCITL